MAVTRDHARRLLSESEMTLFSESRNPALRALTAPELIRRVERTRKLRDKSRDLLQRQRLSSRKRTGSKAGVSGVANERTARKGEVLEDILRRFESRLQEVQGTGGQETASAAGRKVAKAPSKARKPAVATAAAKARKPASPAPQPAARSKPGKAATAAASGASRAVKATTPARAKTPAAAAARKGAAASKAKRPRKAAITPEEALANTRELLEAKHQRDREPRAYQMLDVHAVPGQPDPGYQSGTAKVRAQELHAAEIRLDPIEGSISTRDRQNQGKRDHR